MPKTAPKSTSKAANHKDAKKVPTLSEKIAELDRSVEWFYGDDFSLNEAIERYEAAAALAKSIEQDLKTLKNKISVVEKDFSEE